MRRCRGATPDAAGATFSVWAPYGGTAVVHLADGPAAGDHAMARAATRASSASHGDDARDIFTVHVPGARAGDRYGFRLDGGAPLPDPASRSQPDGVHGLSQVVDPGRFVWHDAHWTGVALRDFVLYELHVGTFTADGTFDAVAARLPELDALGVTAVELMPVAEFPGRRNWGYDGVQLYAPHHAYGGPAGLARLVDAAHRAGIGVVLDVVYNHVGPEGNYLDRFGPYFSDVYRTPWGRAMNYDGPGSDEVRRWARDNALHWIADYHVDALRLDAVHGIYDFGALAFLEELSDEVHELGRQLGRKVQLMAESDLNDPRVVRAPEQGGYGVDAQWADDVHHTIHATLTGERQGHYQDFAGQATIADVYREPFFHARRYSARRGRVHGRSSAGVPRQRFVVSAQNHDQVGNRPGGERLAALLPPDRTRLAAALVLLSPYLPLLFMGEEYGETTPFLYFIEHGDPALVQAVRDGRRREHDAHGALGAPDAHLPPSDPQAEETFSRSRLRWAGRTSAAGARLLRLHTDLIALRRREPALRPGASVAGVEGGADWCTVVRTMPARRDGADAPRPAPALWYAFNLGGAPRDIPLPAQATGQWRLELSTDAVVYGGSGIPAPVTPDGAMRLAPWSASVYVRDHSDGKVASVKSVSS